MNPLDEPHGLPSAATRGEEWNDRPTLAERSNIDFQSRTMETGRNPVSRTLARIAARFGGKPPRAAANLRFFPAAESARMHAIGHRNGLITNRDDGMSEYDLEQYRLAANYGATDIPATIGLAFANPAKSQAILDIAIEAGVFDPPENSRVVASYVAEGMSLDEAHSDAISDARWRAGRLIQRFTAIRNESFYRYRGSSNVPTVKRAEHAARLLENLASEMQAQHEPATAGERREGTPYEPAPMDEEPAPYKPRTRGGVGWNPMEIQIADMPHSLVPRLPSRRRSPSGFGATISYPSRFVFGSTIFLTRERRPQGGTVLIDTSGSMSLDSDDVLDILRRLPAAMIASYSSRDSQGYLRIIARHKRRAADRYLCTPGGGNGCDGPALEWLSRQTGPRIWVSDGWVTGAHSDGMVSDSEAYAVIRLCRYSRIRRVEMEDLRQAIGDKLPPGRPPIPENYLGMIGAVALDSHSRAAAIR